jgi:hypothetical protein
MEEVDTEGTVEIAALRIMKEVGTEGTEETAAMTGPEEPMST